MLSTAGLLAGLAVIAGVASIAWLLRYRSKVNARHESKVAAARRRAQERAKHVASANEQRIAVEEREIALARLAARRAALAERRKVGISAGDENGEPSSTARDSPRRVAAAPTRADAGGTTATGTSNHAVEGPAASSAELAGAVMASGGVPSVAVRSLDAPSAPAPICAPIARPPEDLLQSVLTRGQRLTEPEHDEGVALPAVHRPAMQSGGAQLELAPHLAVRTEGRVEIPHAQSHGVDQRHAAPPFQPDADGAGGTRLASDSTAPAASELRTDMAIANGEGSPSLSEHPGQREPSSVVEPPAFESRVALDAAVLGGADAETEPNAGHDIDEPEAVATAPVAPSPATPLRPIPQDKALNVSAQAANESPQAREPDSADGPAVATACTAVVLIEDESDDLIEGTSHDQTGETGGTPSEVHSDDELRLVAPSPDDTNQVTAPTNTPRQRRYKPVVREPSRPHDARPRDGAATTRDRATPIDVRLVFKKGGACSISLLPRRAPDMPTDVAVAGVGGSYELSEMQDDWYDDVHVEQLGELLASGVAWESRSGTPAGYRWLLSGRDIYVLAPHEQLHGFINTPRLVLGEQHVVLCTELRADEVRAAIAATESPAPVELGYARGTPENWIAFKDVVPRRPVPAGESADILDCLRPHADVKFSFDGGIRLEGNTWLAGFAPSIRLLGDEDSVGRVFIDGHEAARGVSGELTVPGWDTAGAHLVETSIGSRAYSIQEGRQSWQPWEALDGTSESDVAGDKRSRSRGAVCGALVIAPRSAALSRSAVVVPQTNRVLIGAVPGQIEICVPQPDLPSNATCLGFPDFDPVWAVPMAALRCDKRTTRVVRLPLAAGCAPSAVPRPNHCGRTLHMTPAQKNVHAWCSAILSAARKGLAVDPNDSDVVKLWKMYRDHARSLSRSMR